MRQEIIRIQQALSQKIIGKEHQLKLAITCLLANGHLLIEDLPGMGKTTLSHALSQVFGLQYSRIQFTSDLLPSDMLGVNIFHSHEREEEKRFTFYDILPNFEVVTPDDEPDVARDAEPQAIVEPGVYVLQAGSFSTNADADRRRAELALHGIESHIQRVKVNDRNYHRVYIGPTDDLDELNLLRSRLRVAKIDVFRIRLSD